MTLPDHSERDSIWQRVRRAFSKERRFRGALDGFPWFRAGYFAGLDDAHQRPWPETTDERLKAADAALGRWIETGSAAHDEQRLHEEGTNG